MRIVVNAAVRSVDVPRVRPRQRVQLSPGAAPGAAAGNALAAANVEATVEFIGAAVDAANDTVLVREDEAVGDIINGGLGRDVIMTTDGGAVTLNVFGPANSIEEWHGLRRGIQGTNGNDLLDFSATLLVDVPEIDGRDGDDTIGGSNFNDDSILGGNGDDELSGNDGDDRLEGEQGDDMLFGGNGEDTVNGGIGADTLDGGDGNDLLDGGRGDDENIGGAGDDIIKVRDWEAVNDGFDGGDGFDTIINAGVGAVKLENFFSPINGIERWDGQWRGIQGTDGDNRLDFSATELYMVDGVGGGAGNDTVIGSFTDDDLFGGDGNDLIGGLGGADSLEGGNGDDRLVGGDGADTLEGLRGNDTLTGGADADLFVLRGNFGDDTFTDVNLNEGDRISNENFDRQVELVQYIANQGYRVDFTHTDDFLMVTSLVPDQQLEDYLNDDFMLP